MGYWQRRQSGAMSGFAFAPKVVEKAKCEADAERTMEDNDQVWREMAAQRQAAEEAADRAAFQAAEEEQAKMVKESIAKKLEIRHRSVQLDEKRKQLDSHRRFEGDREQQKKAEELARIESIERARKKGADMAIEWRWQREELARLDDDCETDVPNSPRPSISSRASSRSSRSNVSSVRLPLSFARKARANSRRSRRVS